MSCGHSKIILNFLTQQGLLEVSCISAPCDVVKALRNSEIGPVIANVTSCLQAISEDMEKRETLLKAVKDTAEVLMGQAGMQDESAKGMHQKRCSPKLCNTKHSRVRTEMFVTFQEVPKASGTILLTFHSSSAATTNIL